MTKVQSRHLLAPHLAWFINLRWITGIAVCCAGAIDRWVLRWYPNSMLILAVGLGVLIYNAVLWALLHSASRGAKFRLLHLAVVQMLLDLACLALLARLDRWIAKPDPGIFCFPHGVCEFAFAARLGLPECADRKLLSDWFVSPNRSASAQSSRWNDPGGNGGNAVADGHPRPITSPLTFASSTGGWCGRTSASARWLAIFASISGPWFGRRRWWRWARW